MPLRPIGTRFETVSRSYYTGTGTPTAFLWEVTGYTRVIGHDGQERIVESVRQVVRRNEKRTGGHNA